MITASTLAMSVLADPVFIKKLFRLLLSIFCDMTSRAQEFLNNISDAKIHPIKLQNSDVYSSDKLQKNMNFNIFKRWLILV